MKVCTDACLFGAVVAGNLKTVLKEKATVTDLSLAANILDIGCGTGLLALMLAQKTNGLIEAIEINKDAFLQAGENILSSPWKHRIDLIHGDVKAHAFTSQYDLIISNPPFFEQHLRSPKEGINMARHDDTLTYTDLVHVVHKALSPDGCFAVLIPFHQFENVIQVARNAGLFLHHHISVKQTHKHDPFRSICLFFLDEPSQATEKEMIIKEEDNYSKGFVDLLKDYYLNL